MRTDRSGVQRILLVAGLPCPPTSSLWQPCCCSPQCTDYDTLRIINAQTDMSFSVPACFTFNLI
uniref:Uncharacterized protein n=1 Tax=Anguilla anguilla TaxID=7936 RepID=A0A0E9PPM6_ANGAN